MNVREKHDLFEPLKVWILSWIVLKDYPIPDLRKVNSEACIFHGYKSPFFKLYCLNQPNKSYTHQYLKTTISVFNSDLLFSWKAEQGHLTFHFQILNHVTCITYSLKIFKSLKIKKYKDIRIQGLSICKVCPRIIFTSFNHILHFIYR